MRHRFDPDRFDLRKFKLTNTQARNIGVHIGTDPTSMIWSVSSEKDVLGQPHSRVRNIWFQPRLSYANNISIIALGTFRSDYDNEYEYDL